MAITITTSDSGTIYSCGTHGELDDTTVYVAPKTGRASCKTCATEYGQAKRAARASGQPVTVRSGCSPRTAKPMANLPKVDQEVLLTVLEALDVARAVLDTKEPARQGESPQARGNRLAMNRRAALENVREHLERAMVEANFAHVAAAPLPILAALGEEPLHAVAAA